MLARTVIFGIFLTLAPDTFQQPQDSESGTVRLSKVNPGRYVPDLYGANKGKYKPDESGKYIHQHMPYDGGYGDRGLKYIHDFINMLQRPPDNNISNGNNNLLLGPKDHLRFMVDFNYNSSGWQIINFEWIRDGDQEKQYHYKNENQLWQNSLQTASESVENESDKYYYSYEPGNSVNDHAQQQQHESHTSADSTSAHEDSAAGDYLNDEQTTELDYEEQGHDSIANEAAESDSVTNDSQATDANANTNTNVHVQGDYADHKYNLSYENDNQYPRRDAQEVRQAIQEVLDYIQNYILPTL